MVATHGTISKFDHEVEDWKTYVKRVNLYMANDITNSGKKRAVLLSVCGAKKLPDN